MKEFVLHMTPKLGQVSINDLDYSYLELGSGPLALLLHGFPDTADGWIPLMRRLAEDGYRAIAPYMRGYAPTAVPASGLSPIQAWVADGIEFGRHFGSVQPGVIIGHDWGAIATYGIASSEPDLWSHVVTASIPPMSVMATHTSTYDQLKRFWYQYVFLQPSAEATVQNNDFAFLTKLWADWSPDLAPASVERALGSVRAALSPPVHLTAALSTYRCLYDPTKAGSEFADYAFSAFVPHTQPTLYLHGENDGCVGPVVFAEVEAALPPGSRVAPLPNSGHFVQYDATQTVCDLVSSFVTGDPASSP